VYPETKHPGYFDSIGLSLEEPLVAALDANGWGDGSAPVFVQSFEIGNLRQLARLTKVRLVLLVGADGQPGETLSRERLAAIAEVVHALGIEKDLAIPRDASGALGAPTTLIADAHEAGLLVHAWTFRAENFFVPTDLRRGDPADPAFLAMPGDMGAEVRAFARAGVDGIFADQPDVAVDALAR
jgi:glycerophosphoryl diester phosphodiesterase